MAVEYKNVVKEITTTGSDQVIYTCPTTTSLVKYMAIIKTCTVFNTTAGQFDVVATDYLQHRVHHAAGSNVSLSIDPWTQIAVNRKNGTA